MTQSLEGSNTKIAKQSTFPIKASLILSQKACFVSPLNRVVAPNFGCQMTVLLRKTFFLQACLRNLLFHKVLKKIFAGVNRHQGTLKVQGPWSFLWLNLIKVSLNLIRTTQWIIVNPKFIQTFSTARNAGRTNAVAACGMRLPALRMPLHKSTVYTQDNKNVWRMRQDIQGAACGFPHSGLCV